MWNMNSISIFIPTVRRIADNRRSLLSHITPSDWDYYGHGFIHCTSAIFMSRGLRMPMSPPGKKCRRRLCYDTSATQIFEDGKSNCLFCHPDRFFRPKRLQNRGIRGLNDSSGANGKSDAHRSNSRTQSVPSSNLGYPSIEGNDTIHQPGSPKLTSLQPHGDLFAVASGFSGEQNNLSAANAEQ